MYFKLPERSRSNHSHQDSGHWRTFRDTMGKYLVGLLILGIFLLHCLPTDCRPKNRSKKENHIAKTDLHAKGIKGKTVKRDLSRHFLHLPKRDVEHIAFELSEHVQDNDTQPETPLKSDQSEPVNNATDLIKNATEVVVDKDHVVTTGTTADTVNQPGKEPPTTAVITNEPVPIVSENSTQNESKAEPITAEANKQEKEPAPVSDSLRKERSFSDLLDLPKTDGSEPIPPLDSFEPLKSELTDNLTQKEEAKPSGEFNIGALVELIVSDETAKFLDAQNKSKEANEPVRLLNVDARIVPERVEALKPVMDKPDQAPKMENPVNASEVKLALEPDVALLKTDELIKAMHLDEQIIPRRLGELEKTDGETKTQDLQTESKPANTDEKLSPENLEAAKDEETKLPELTVQGGINTDDANKPQEIQVKLEIKEELKPAGSVEQVKGENLEEKKETVNLEVQAKPLTKEEETKLSDLADGTNAEEKKEPVNLEVGAKPLAKEEETKPSDLADGTNAEEKKEPLDLDVPAKPLTKEEETKPSDSADGTSAEEKKEPLDLEVPAKPLTKEEEAKPSDLADVDGTKVEEKKEPQNSEAQDKPITDEQIKPTNLEVEEKPQTSEEELINKEIKSLEEVNPPKVR